MPMYMSIEIYKKKTIEKLKKDLKEKGINEDEYSISDIYHNYLYSFSWPEDYNIPEDEIGRNIAEVPRNVFKSFKKLHIKDNEVIEISRWMYNDMIRFLEYELKHTSLFDIRNSEAGLDEVRDMLTVYRALVKYGDQIDFNNELVLFMYD